MYILKILFTSIMAETPEVMTAENAPPNSAVVVEVETRCLLAQYFVEAWRVGSVDRYVKAETLLLTAVEPRLEHGEDGRLQVVEFVQQTTEESPPGYGQQVFIAPHFPAESPYVVLAIGSPVKIVGQAFDDKLVRDEDLSDRPVLSMRVSATQPSLRTTVELPDGWDDERVV